MRNESVKPSSAGVPLRLTGDKIWFFGTLCAVFSSLPFIIAPQRLGEMATLHDFANFWSAGSTVGTRLLTDVKSLAAWQTAHHVGPQPFVYPPGFAWIYAPLAHLPPVTAMIVEQLVMTALFALAAWLAAKIYGFPLWFALVATFAWGPTLGTIEDGQNTGLSLVLVLLAIRALVQRRPFMTGLATGALLYKPTDAAALIVLLTVRREWRALGAASLVALIWYVLSVIAAAGDWRWPVRYAETVRDWYAVHSAGNPHMVFTLPTVVLAAGAPIIVALAAAVIVLIAAVPLLARTSSLEAASMATLVGVTVSMHAWSYTAALILPAVFYAMTHIREPWRTRVVATAYIAAAIGTASASAGFALAVICIGGTALWLVGSYSRQLVDRQARPSAADASS